MHTRVLMLILSCSHAHSPTSVDARTPSFSANSTSETSDMPTFTDAYNRKNVEVYSPTAAAANGACVSPRDLDTPYAIQVDVVPVTAPAPAPLDPPPSYPRTQPAPAPPAPASEPSSLPVQPSALASQENPYGEWKHGVFTACCCAPSHLFMAIFVPFFSAGYSANGICACGWLVGVAVLLLFAAAIVFAVQMADAMQGYTYYSYSGRAYDHEGDSVLNQWFVGLALVVLALMTIVALLRRAMRGEYVIDGSSFRDCWLSVLCTWCVLTQMSTHTESARQYEANKATLPAYQA